MKLRVAKEAVVYRYAYLVEAVDIDELGHASNVAVVRWIQEAARHASADRGWDEERYRREGKVFVVRRHEIEYLLPAMVGDELLIETWVDEWTAASSRRCTRITRSGQELTRARTDWVFVGAENMKPTRIPKPLKMAFCLLTEEKPADG